MNQLEMNQTTAALAHVNAGEIEHAQKMVEVIARAAADPNTDVSKMERLYAMLKEENARIAEQKFNAAMSRAQAAMPMITKDAKNPQTGSAYVRLESLCIAAAPIIEAEGFSLQFSEGDCPNPAKIRVLCDVSHVGGHTIQRHLDLSPDDMGAKGNASKTKIHGEGSTFTYGRRYLMTMIFNLTVIGADDDGNRGYKPKPSGPSTMRGDTNGVDTLLKELWTLLKPVRGDKQNWDAVNTWLWAEEILDGGNPNDAVQKLPANRLKEVIAAAKGKL